MSLLQPVFLNFSEGSLEGLWEELDALRKQRGAVFKAV